MLGLVWHYQQSKSFNLALQNSKQRSNNINLSHWKHAKSYGSMSEVPPGSCVDTDEQNVSKQLTYCPLFSLLTVRQFNLFQPTTNASKIRTLCYLNFTTNAQSNRFDFCLFQRESFHPQLRYLFLCHSILPQGNCL